MKILVVKPTALGDVAQALLVAPQLKQLSGCTELVWLVDEDYKDLVACSPDVDRIIRFPRKRWKRGLNALEIPAWLRKLRDEQFDLVLDLQGLARSALMTWATGALVRVGLASAREAAALAYTDIVQDDSEHAVDRYAQAVAQILKTTDPVVPRFLVGPELPPYGNLQSGSYTLLHPYSLWKTKLWNWQNFQYLVRALPEETFVLIGQGPWFPLVADNCVDLRGQTDMRQLLGLIGHSRILISTDSGPLHLAAMLGRPVIGLFGATSIAKTGPRYRVGAMLQSGLDCSPCLRRSCTRNERMLCMRENSVETVLQQWRELINLDKNHHSIN